MNTITPATLHDRLKQGAPGVLIDVRTPAEYAAVHAENARNLPLESLQPEQLAGETQPVYLLCKSGARASNACNKLLSAGLSNVTVVEGGTDAWVAAGLPCVQSGAKAPMSLERQVRIAAGALVATGVALGFLVHPVAFLLSGFVGCGLVFAGITDTCAMGMLIARMPWNQCGPNNNNAACCGR